MLLLDRPSGGVVKEAQELQTQPPVLIREILQGGTFMPSIDQTLQVQLICGARLIQKRQRDAFCNSGLRENFNPVVASRTSRLPRTMQRLPGQFRMNVFNELCHIMLSVRLRPPQEPEPQQAYGILCRPCSFPEHLREQAPFSNCLKNMCKAVQE